MSAFKPTRRELRQVQRLANECEIDARVTQQLGSWYGMHRPSQRAAEAMRLAQAVAGRSAGVPA